MSKQFIEALERQQAERRRWAFGRFLDRHKQRPELVIDRAPERGELAPIIRRPHTSRAAARISILARPFVLN